MIKYKISTLVAQQPEGTFWVINGGSMRQITLSKTEDKFVVKIQFKDIVMLVQTKTGNVTFVTWDTSIRGDINYMINDLISVMSGPEITFG